MKKAFILSAAAAVGLFTFGGVQQASAKELSCQHVVTVKTGDTVQNMSLNDVVKKLHIKTNMKTLNAANEKEIKQLLKKHAKQSNMNIQDVQKTETAKPAQKTTEKAAAEKNTASKTPAASKAPAAAEKTNTTTSAPSSVSAYEKKVVELTNAERQKQGLKPLQIDETLSKSARAKSQDMKDKNYFDHQSPTYGSPFDMMKSFGISYKTAGENIAKGQKTPEEVVKAWMNSEGHRKNILNSNFTHIGVGYVESGNIWTQQFIGK
ncbi:CAP domain-containing protein [Bacillus spizizenii]|uniref:CAP domain-containing protein n=1 Tax=Bacillus spizizenii TaxID=96241 RepID=A0A9Q4DQE0_BACSC|nr:CAP domain-containing protein [Bacillus spizizenii]MCY7795593.1 CAP domain-containing protein [Bacillus spizizenii]MCY7802912.1 CAP domain-containing protein [Bacillus spizizenii]MCY7827150.1 CAP domain-containing protein [Bacillus spizizenii]MCY7879140.1 CAP domain-containing protein [Bacillus spizizenii]MCY7896520.1 CAP domain-containing protein [Bacillus spizizenii]